MPAIGSATAIAAALQTAGTVHIACHEHPDGDAIGSLLGLRLALLGLGSRVHVASPTPPPARYAYLPGFSEINTAFPSSAPDLAVAVDCDGASRLGSLQAAIEAAALVADIDHHRPESAFGDLVFIDPTYPATATMVLNILRVMDTQPSPEIAACLYTGLMTDTGAFRFTNTSSAAMRDAADLIDAGADPADLVRRAFTTRSFGAARLEGRALVSLTPYHDGQILLADLSLADFQQTGASLEDTDGLIDEFRDIIGTEIAALLKESEPDAWNVSLRSQRIDVAQIAAAFGGGGHALAAGCTLHGDAQTVREQLLTALGTALSKVGTHG